MGAAERKKWLFLLYSALLISLLIFLSAVSRLSATYASISRTQRLPVAASVPRRGSQYPPAFGYYIFGGNGDRERILRLLLAVYHPRNRYLLHLAMGASDKDTEWLAAAVSSVPAIREFGNVDLIGKPMWLTNMGATNLAATLRAASILLKVDGGWDWFIPLSALDYPLMTQDDLSYVFSTVRRDLNFIDHTSDLSWKETQRIQPIVVDPSLYLARRSQIFTATKKRPTPDAFKVFTGSPWVVLSRPFLEFCIFGWDNLPRMLLMYFNNVILPQESYFHSVICNSLEFRNTTVSNDLRYMMWDNPPKMEPLYLNASVYDEMVNSGAAFARQFKKGDPVLTMLDNKILKRRQNHIVPGAWCTGRDSWFSDRCSQWGDLDAIKPGPRAQKLSESMSSLLVDWSSQTNQC